MYINKIQNTITFKLKTEYYVELLTTETIKLLGKIEKKKQKKKNKKQLKIKIVK